MQIILKKKKKKNLKNPKDFLLVIVIKVGVIFCIYVCIPLISLININGRSSQGK